MIRLHSRSGPIATKERRDMLVYQDTCACKDVHVHVHVQSHDTVCLVGASVQCRGTSHWNIGHFPLIRGNEHSKLPKMWLSVTHSIVYCIAMYHYSCYLLQCTTMLLLRQPQPLPLPLAPRRQILWLHPLPLDLHHLLLVSQQHRDDHK